MSDHTKFAILANRLIAKHGRAVTLKKLVAAPGDPTKPWRGAASPPTTTGGYATVGLFVIPQTAIPRGSRGLAFDWVDKDLLASVDHVCLVPALNAPALEVDYKLVADGGRDWAIVWGQCLQPGDQRLLYVFGLKQ